MSFLGGSHHIQVLSRFGTFKVHKFTFVFFGRHIQCSSLQTTRNIISTFEFDDYPLGLCYLLFLCEFFIVCLFLCKFAAKKKRTSFGTTHLIEKKNSFSWKRKKNLYFSLRKKKTQKRTLLNISNTSVLLFFVPFA